MMAANASLPPVSTGEPREIVRVKPLSRNNVPSVVTNDGTSSRTVISPLTRPTSAAAAPAPAAATPSDRQARLRCAKCIMNGASAKTMPADRSISPQISSMISPQAMIAEAAMNCDRVSRLASVRKLALAAWK